MRMKSTDKEQTGAEDLKPCPFCGNTAKKGKYQQLTPVVISKRRETKTVYNLDIEPHNLYYVHCLNCGARGGMGSEGYNALSKTTTTTDEQARQIAISKWNRRTE